ncbi:MAG: S8 family serine peptidase [bacterium]
MKKILFFFFFISFSLSGAEIYYSNGSFKKIDKIQGFSVVKSSASVALKIPQEIMRLRMGEEVFSIVEGEGGDRPLYRFGEMPVIAGETVFWRGDKEVGEIERKYNLKLEEILSIQSLYSFKVIEGDSVEIAASIVENGDGYAFPNLIKEARLHYVPGNKVNDPYFDVQWHLENRGEVSDYYDNNQKTLKNADIKFSQALAVLHKNKHEVDDTIKIAIMDTGIVPNHEDLTNVEPGYDAFNDTEGGYPDTSVIEGLPWYQVSGVAHGTTCAGVSAAVGNDIGMIGVCPWCNLYPVRYLDGFSGTVMDDAKIVKSYEKYIGDPKISVINCSFGPIADYGYVPMTAAEMESHLAFMKEGRGGLGGVIVYASGNDGVDSSYSELLKNVFSFERDGVAVEHSVVVVNASSAWDTRVVYSNYGPASTVSAPSLSQNPMVGIATTTIPGFGDYMNDYTRLFSGTSAAAPVVAGYFGTIFSVNPNLTLEEAMEIMKQSSDKIHPETGSWDKSGFSVKYGYGRINLEKAVRLAMGLEMCEVVREEICGNNIDDNCDGFVDEGCENELLAGTPCESSDDCLSELLTEADVECVKEKKYWKFKDGYCMRKTNNAPCPDGTKAFDYADGGENYICAAECSEANPCKRKGYYCTHEVLGVCVPSCKKNSECAEGSYCDEWGECVKNPSDLGGSCANDKECAGSMWCLPYFQDGYCTSDCQNEDDSMCPDEGKCVKRRSGGGGGSIDICLSSCSSDTHCRDGEYYICHANMSDKEGVCFRKCRNDGDCMDPDAVCNEDGRCAHLDWTGWVEDEKEEPADLDDVDSDSDVSEIPDKDEKENIKPEKDNSFACSIVNI